MSDPTARDAASPSLVQRSYWWYEVRASLLRQVFYPAFSDAQRWIDVGSADGPSVQWAAAATLRVNVDINPSGLVGLGVCADGRRLPFAEDAFDVLTAFDVLEHFLDEDEVLAEFRRVVRTGGLLCFAVPAYQWAWTPFDVAQGHYRRYTRPRLHAALERHDLDVVRSTHAFSAVFPFFAASRLAQRVKGGEPDDTLPPVGRGVETVLRRLSRIDERWLTSRDLPFGSSIFALAKKR